MSMHNFCSCHINFKVTNLTLYMYLFIEISDIYMYLYTIYVDMHIKTILAVKFHAIKINFQKYYIFYLEVLSLKVIACQSECNLLYFHIYYIGLALRSLLIAQVSTRC